ncbi:Uncharacterized protein rosmuc_02323 [Roseovarius mucosus DSM 17069]|uniref:DUF1643 domain-containing protein n=1 Tax=Roseovarius mucosus DSM 17069 TaxID=1288298 RepID=A0A0A0HID4_9RHOB|nr:DUF1643 domain-containing protein [Roseovarius mucosus]KGM87587.1 Uncharacterized protein rosmuc_02323 [Roseovarius mucosus DSM 17069]
MNGGAPDHLHDPGGKVRLRLPDGVIGGAEYSDCGRYRQVLSRDWTADAQAPRRVLFVGMNPSVASAEVSDPTCHREVMFAKDWGYSFYFKGNMLDWRATSPKDLPREPDVACSAANIPALVAMAEQSELVVLAYGKLHERYQGVVRRALREIAATSKPLMCLGLNKDGSAKHPLYLRKDTPLMAFPMPV